MSIAHPVNSENKYDWMDSVRRCGRLEVGSLKMAVYQVRDPETGEWSKRQFHATYDNHVMAVMSEEAAKLFATFVQMNTDEARPVPTAPDATKS